MRASDVPMIRYFVLLAFLAIGCGDTEEGPSDPPPVQDGYWVNPFDWSDADPDLDPSATAFIQFTSGTTELPKGVKLSHAALSANVEQIGQRSALDGESTIVSWLPLYHDMGLIGGMLTAALSGADLVLTSPMSFLRQPKIWLELLDRHRGTHSPAPTFAYRYLLDRLKDQDLEGIDLSSWRVA